MRPRVRFPFIATALAVPSLAVPSLALAQPARPGVVLGAVHDSIGGGPMRGAEVWLDPAQAGGAPRSATVDAEGAFRFDGVPAGEYTIGFSHPTLDSLGVGTSEARLHVGGDDTTAVRLSTPSLQTIARRACPGLATDTAGALAGRVRDGANGAAVAARVTVQWNELTAAGNRLATQLRTRSVRTRDDGAFMVCGVPNDVSVTVQALADVPRGAESGVREGVATLDLHGRVLTVHDLAVAPLGGESAAEGSAGLTLLVRGPEGRPIPTAHATVGGRSAASDDSGRVTLARLAGGSQVVTVRALGYEPATLSVRLRPDATVQQSVALGLAPATQLETVRITAKSAVALDPTGFELRRLQGGFGHFVTTEDIQRRQATALSQLLRSVPGVQVVPLKGGIGYAVMSHHGMMGPNTAAASGATIGECPMTIFVDGVKMYDAFSRIDELVAPPNIRGIEVYAGSATIPQQYADGKAACGAVLIWTHNGRR